jgi:D-serine dehydratase
MERLLDGYFTVSDQRMYQLLGQLSELEDIQLEPSALAGMLGPVVVTNNHEYRQRMQFDDKVMNNATHLVWATGGGMVPDQEMLSYLDMAHRVEM